MNPCILALGAMLAKPTPNACDAKALKARMASASPQEATAVFEEASKCDAALVKELAPAEFQKVIPGPDGQKAALIALKAGAADVVRAWVSGQISDERARTIAALGNQCTGNPEVVNFFVESQKVLGDQFWRDRWHRGLAGCREPAVQELLKTAILNPTPDASRFGSYLEVFSRNLGAKAIPVLKEIALTASPENQLAIVGSFADAAGVGSEAGMDPEASRQAVATILEIAPKLAPKAVEQARVTVESLGDQKAADSLAGVRFSSVKQADGSLLWGVISVETVKCKNEKTVISAHAGAIKESGTHWPDQMQNAADQLVKKSWELNAAQKCKGEGTISVILGPEPFIDMKALLAWRDPIVKEVGRRPADKHATKVEEDLLVQP